MTADKDAFNKTPRDESAREHFFIINKQYREMFIYFEDPTHHDETGAYHPPKVETENIVRKLNPMKEAKKKATVDSKHIILQVKKLGC